MSFVTVHVNIYLAVAQNDAGRTAEYQSEVALINHNTKERAHSMEYSEIQDNKKYDPPRLLQSAMHTVRRERGQKVTASLKMFEDDIGRAGDPMAKGDDFYFNDTFDYDPAVPYIRKEWKGTYDKGYYTLNFVTC